MDTLDEQKYGELAEKLKADFFKALDNGDREEAVASIQDFVDGFRSQEVNISPEYAKKEKQEQLIIAFGHAVKIITGTIVPAMSERNGDYDGKNLNEFISCIAAYGFIMHPQGMELGLKSSAYLQAAERNLLGKPALA